MSDMFATIETLDSNFSFAAVPQVITPVVTAPKKVDRDSSEQPQLLSPSIAERETTKKAATIREANARSRAMLQRAMHQCDDLVVVFDYCDCHGRSTRRVVSPIRFIGHDLFLGLCLSREAPRQFYRERCKNMRLALASSFVMPVPMN
jgi:predicted DNA-binding transcriptional regulator YafY